MTGAGPFSSIHDTDLSLESFVVPLPMLPCGLSSEASGVDASDICPKIVLPLVFLDPLEMTEVVCLPRRGLVVGEDTGCIVYCRVAGELRVIGSV